MFVLTERIDLPEKIDLPRRAQIFNDYVDEDAAQEKRENDNRWRNKVLNAIAAIVRNFQK